MENFLEAAKTALPNLENHGKVHVVLGNEACDLDSAVAALVYAFYLHKTNVHPDTVIIPLLNIKRQELRLRTEIIYFFKENLISPEQLIFREDVHLKALNERGKLSLTLVDHNQLARSDFSFYSAVSEVIDHHKKEANYEPSRCNITIEQVGSCCTLIADKILKNQPGFLDQKLALLLYGTILLDTVCLNEVAKRVTAKDKTIATELEKLLIGVNRVELFQSLYTAKFNISDFTMEELLNRDLKVISNNTMNIPISSLTTSLQEVLKRPEAEAELKKFSLKTNSQIVILMGIEINMVTQETSRQLAIYSQIQGYREQLVDVLESASIQGPKLQLQVLPSPFSSIILYKQGNIAASRKVILPLLNTFLLGDQSPSFPNCSGASCATSNCDHRSGGRLPPEGRSDDEDGGYFDPLAAESEDVVLDSMANSSSHLHVLGMGDPISHAGSSQSSSNQNSCPYTPQNSCTDGGLELDPYARQILPSFNSREMMEKIESKRGKLRGYVGDGESDASYPFTPKNSFVDNTFESYVKNVGLPSFDSGDLLLKVNEKVSTMDSGAAGNEVTGNIIVKVPVLDQPHDKMLKNGHSDVSVLKEKLAQLEVKNDSGENGESGAANVATDPEIRGGDDGDKNKENVQRCPEAISLSDKLDKSDEKMDTSETSGSSEKTSPFPNDLEVQNSTATTLTGTANTITHCTTECDSITTNTYHLTQKNTEGAHEATNSKTDSSTASVSSLQGEEVDLEMPVNYQTETVDFPDSPRQLKLMNQSMHEHKVRGASNEDALREEDEETEQPDDDVFRAVLSPSSEGVKLKKAKIIPYEVEVNRSHKSSYLSDSTDSKDESIFLPLNDTELESDDYFEDSIVTASTGIHFVTSKSFKSGHEDETVPKEASLPIDPDRSSLDNEYSFKNSFKSKNDLLHAMQDLNVSYTSSTPIHGAHSKTPISGQAGKDGKSIGESETSASDISQSTIQKVRSCFDQEKIKDIYMLCGKLHELLTPQEIDEVLQNSETYAEFFDAELFETLIAVRVELPTESDCSGGPSEDTLRNRLDTADLGNGKKTKIQINKDTLDQSILDHFESELHISAIFEGTSSVRLNKKTKLRPKLENITEVATPSSLKFVEVPSGIAEAFFEESVGETTRTARRKICIDLTSDALDNSSSSPEAGKIRNFKPETPDGILTELKFESSEESANSVNSLIETCDMPALKFTSIHMSDGSQSSPERPNTLNASGKKKLKIRVNPDILNSSDDHDDKSLSSLSNRSEGDILSPIDDIATPDDIDTPDFFEDSTFSPSESIPEVSAAEERDEERRWRTCVIGGVQRKIDMKVIEPYKKVLSHGGYYGPKRSAIIVFCACYLPDHSRKDYDYVMDNLFLYVLTTLDQLVAEDYILIYLHGAMDRNNMPTFGWLKRCYQMIDRRLRKNLKGLYLVHPTFWLKTIVVMTRPFISSKFSRKLQFVNTLQELSEIVPIDQMSIPDRVKQFEFELMIKEKKKHVKTPILEDKRTKSSEQSKNDLDCDANEEAYRRADIGYDNFTGGWV